MKNAITIFVIVFSFAQITSMSLDLCERGQRYNAGTIILPRPSDPEDYMAYAKIVDAGWHVELAGMSRADSIAFAKIDSSEKAGMIAINMIMVSNRK